MVVALAVNTFFQILIVDIGSEKSCGFFKANRVSTKMCDFAKSYLILPKVMR